MSTFKIRYACSIIPVEEVTLSDGSQSLSAVNSNIDKIFGSNNTKTFGTTATNVQTAEYNTTTTYNEISNIISNLPQTISFLYVRIKSALGSSTPDCLITLDGGTTPDIILQGVNDFCVVPCSSGTLDILFKSLNTNSRAVIEILVGGQ